LTIAIAGRTCRRLTTSPILLEWGRYRCDNEVYEPDTDQKGIAEIIIGKQRNGPIGTVRLAWLGEFTRFENYAGPRFDEE